MLNVTLIDNYDSFTFNLVHYFGALGAKVRVLRNDQASVDEVVGEEPGCLVLSPGPCTPREAGICLDLIRAAAHDPDLRGVPRPSAIGEAFGGEVVRAPTPIHGKINDMIHEKARHVFRGLPRAPSRPRAIIPWSSRRDSLPTELAITAKTSDGLIMGLSPSDPIPSTACSSIPEASPPNMAMRLLARFPRPGPSLERRQEGRIDAGLRARHGKFQAPFCTVATGAALTAPNRNRRSNCLLSGTTTGPDWALSSWGCARGAKRSTR